VTGACRNTAAINGSTDFIVHLGAVMVVLIWYLCN